MAETIYHKLRRQMDQYSVGFPETESGVEIKILQRLFTPDEAELFLELSMQLEAPSDFAARTGGDPEKTAERLETMARKGTLFRKRKGDKVFYAAVPFVIGAYEFHLKQMDREFARLMEQYKEERFSASIADCITPLRTIPVHKSLDVKHNVAPYSDARQIIRSKEIIAVSDCICRAQKKLIDKGCGRVMEACFSFGSHAEYYIENKLGRRIGQEEALEILDRCEEEGLVNQPASMINPGGMCNCCSDCCGVLEAIYKLPKPAEMVMNSYRAAVDADLCIGCELCIERCHMAAVTMDGNSIATINNDRCIGCGLCVTTCPQEAVTLETKEGDVAIPASGMEYMLKNAEGRGTSLIPLSMEGK